MKRAFQIVGYVLGLGGLAFAVWPLLLYLHHSSQSHAAPDHNRPAQAAIGTPWDAWGSSAAGRLRTFGLPPKSSDAMPFSNSGSDWWERPVFTAATAFQTYSSEEETLAHFAAVARRIGWTMRSPRVFEHPGPDVYRLEIETACAAICAVKLMMQTNEPWLL